MHQRAQRDSRCARIECACGYSHRVRVILDIALPSQHRRLEWTDGTQCCATRSNGSARSRSRRRSISAQSALQQHATGTQKGCRNKEKKAALISCPGKFEQHLLPPAASTSEQTARRACSTVRACNGDHLPSSDSSAALADPIVKSRSLAARRPLVCVF